MVTGEDSLMRALRVFYVTWLAAMILLPASTYGQDVKLVDGAKKEGGKVVVYGSIENDTMDLIAAALKTKRRPGLKLSSGARPARRSWTGCLARCGPASRSMMWC
jgi:hypothetical protein